MFCLVWFRERRPVTLTGRGLGISQATAYRYLDEAIGILAAEAPKLSEALEQVAVEGWSHVILDGKVVATDRLTSEKVSTKGTLIDAWYSGKSHDFGGNIQAVMRRTDSRSGSPTSNPARPTTSAAPAATPYPPCTPPPRSSNLPTLADSGYDGAGIGVHTPVRQPADGAELDPDTRTYNMLLRALRCLGERGFALIAGRWRTLQHVTVSPSKIGKIAKAALVLTHFEHSYSPCRENLNDPHMQYVGAFRYAQSGDLSLLTGVAFLSMRVCDLG